MRRGLVSRWFLLAQRAHYVRAVLLDWRARSGGSHRTVIGVPIRCALDWRRPFFVFGLGWGVMWDTVWGACFPRQARGERGGLLPSEIDPVPAHLDSVGANGHFPHSQDRASQYWD